MKNWSRIISIILLSLSYFGLINSTSQISQKRWERISSLPAPKQIKESPQSDTVRSKEYRQTKESSSLQVISKINIPAGMSRELVFEPGISGKIIVGGASLFIPAGSLNQKTTSSVTALTADDLPKIPPEISNVTSGYYAGYRFLPHGMLFDSAVYISIAYDQNLLPEGYSSEDVYTFYFDETDKKWKALERDSIDHKEARVISRTLHFTDMINGIIKVPESPETEGFVPISLQNIKAADPGAGITQINAPAANNQGDAILNFLLKIPVGRKGFQPDLSLSYNSSQGSGWTGYGWGLNVPGISVDIAWGVPRYLSDKESETYILNGIQLTPVAHRDEYVDREADKQFYSRIEQDFLKIIRHGNRPNNYWWETTDKYGARFFYGGTPETGIITEAVSMTSSGNIGYWALVKTVDVHENFVSYTYDKPADCGQQIYISEITYTGYKQVQGAYRVNFLRSDPAGKFIRRDQPVNARYGFITRDKELLHRVIISYNDDTIRSYTLNYKEGAFLKTLLESITEFDSEGNKYYTQQFDYYNDVQENNAYRPYATEVKWDLPDDGLKDPYLNPLNIFFDNVSALGGSESTGGSGGLSTTLGLFDGLVYSKSNTAGGNINYQHSKSEGFLCLVDLNGDGLSDKVYKKDGTIYYRPNIMGYPGNIMFGEEKVVDGIDNFSLSKTNAFGGGAEAHPLIAFVGNDFNWSKTKTSVYFADFNADGLVDLAYNGTVLFNHINENGEPVFTASSQATPNPIVGQSEIDIGILPDPAEEQSMLEKQFPLHDAVRMWQAPFDGTVSIQAPVNLLNVASDDNHTDGVKVNVQHGDSILWSNNIGAGDYSVKYPGLDSIDVKKGDRFYFRVQSVYNGSADNVLWDPEINYSKILSNDTLPKLFDFNNKQSGRFRASEDFILSGNQSIGMPKDGAVKIKTHFSKPLTSDTLYLEIFYSDSLGTSSMIFRKKYNCEEVVTGDSIVFNRDVFEDEYITFKVSAATNIDWSKITCTNYVEYTRIDDGTPVTGNDGNPLLSFRCIPDFYPMYNHYVKQEFPLILDSAMMVSLNLSPGDTSPQPLEIFPELSFTNPSDPQTEEDIVFALKKNKRILTNHTYKYLRDTVNNKDTLSIQVQRDDTLDFGFYIKNIYLAEGINSAKALLISPSNEVNNSDASIYSTIDPNDEIFGKLYRGWGQFDYRGDSIWGTAPIDESLLIPPDAGNTNVEDIDTSNLGGINIGGDVFNLMVPYTEKDLYMGVDEYVYVMDEYMSSSRRGEKDVLVEPITITDASVVPVSRENREITNSVSAGAGAFGVSGSYSHSWLNGDMLIDMVDMNGDRFPDLLTSENIQYTGVTGVLKGSPVKHTLGDHSSKAHADGFTAGGSFVVAKSNNSASPGSVSAKEDNNYDVKEKNSRRNNKSGQAEETAKTSFGISGNFSLNRDRVDQTWMDINADGLPDKIYIDGTVRLNLGYSFADPESWGFDSISSGISQDYGGGLGVNIANGSIMAGVGISYTKSESKRSFMDINGDGLEDIIINNASLDLSFHALPSIDRNLTVQFNTGSGFAQPVSWPGITALNQGQSIGESATGAFTVGILIPLTPPLKWCINPSTSITHGISNTLTQIADIDGDGLPDFLSSGAEGELYVKSSRIGRTNKIKQVDQPMGSSIYIDYKLTPATYEHPGGKLVMASVKIFDGVDGDGVDTTLNTFDYSKGYYDRHERQFYGYEAVKTKSQNTADNNSLYRIIEQKFSIKDYYTNGRLLEETVFDGEGNKQKGSQNIYSLADIQTGEILPESAALSDRSPFFVALTGYIDYTYEGSDSPQISARETYAYNTMGNVSAYTNYYSGNENDKYTVTINYHTNSPKNILAVPSHQEVITIEGLKRKSTTSINEYGDIVQVTKSISDNESAIFDLEYDPYGNLIKITRPANYQGERLWYQYKYDSILNTFITKIIDAYGYSSASKYDFKFGVILSTSDKNNQQVEYQYDPAGRLTTVTGPYELTQGKPYTIAFEYHPEAEIPFTRTRHRQSDDTDIEIFTFVDGIGRVIQVKKSAMLFNNVDAPDSPGFIISGKVLYDAFGREAVTYQPVFENGSDPARYNSDADNIRPVVKNFDVLDRVLQVELPNGSVSKYRYDVVSFNGEMMHVDSLTDELGNLSLTYTRVNGRKAAIVKTGDAGDITTTFSYDALGELQSIIDPNGNSTVSEYDMLGRRISVEQADAGLTEYTYDGAGNLIKKITANLRKYIPEGGENIYHYNFERLTEIVYPRNIQNRVNYTYGDPGAAFNRAGRIVLIEDASGGQEFFYSSLGQIEKTIRTIQLGESDIRTFIWGAKYDTWNRVHSLTYPDGEVVTYTYDRAGNLQQMDGEKLNRSYRYISRIGYNKFEKQVYLKYGNGSEIRYQYEDKLQRLDQVSLISGGQEIMNNSYTYDAVSNILAINSNPTGISDIGGATSQTYTYDRLYRLTGASGFYTGAGSNSEYKLTMQYDNMGNILARSQEHLSEGQIHDASSYDFEYSYEGSSPNAASQIGSRVFSYDENGNQISWEDSQSNAYRQLAWDEENRLTMISDEGYMSNYVYDSYGERVIKSHGGSRGVYLNGAPAGILNHSFNDYTVYLSPYMVFQNNRFTKHYYAGSTRIASKIGNGEFHNLYRAGVLELTAGGVNYINRQQQLRGNKEEFEKQIAQTPGPPTMKGIYTDPLISGTAYPDAGTPDAITPHGWPQKPVIAPPGGPPGAPVQWGDYINNENVEPGFGFVGTGYIEENLRYFYHSDHLGSTQYVTNTNGDIVQFIAYMPFGETFIEQHNGWDSPYKFNAKELDGETGLYYYGTRYYDPKICTWLGVDPLTLNTPTWSPYAYTFDNPVVYTDPDGQLPLVSFMQNAGKYLNKSSQKAKSGKSAKRENSGGDLSGNSKDSPLGQFDKSYSAKRNESAKEPAVKNRNNIIKNAGFSGDIETIEGVTTTGFGRFEDGVNGGGTGPLIKGGPNVSISGENRGGLNLLNISNWTWTRNMAWIWDAGNRGDIIRFISDPTDPRTIYKNGTGGEKTVTGKEIQLLHTLGYVWNASNYTFIRP